MRVRSSFLVVLLCLGAAGGTAAAQQPPAAPNPAASGPQALDLIEDLRLLTLVHRLDLTKDQLTKLAAVAVSAREGLAAVEAAVDARLDLQRARLQAARARMVQGGGPSLATDTQYADAVQAAEAIRARRMESLIESLAARVRRILNPEQASRIENELAPSTDQPWRRYARLLPPPARTGSSPSRLPADPGYWLHELRDLRIDSAEGDPKVEIQDFGHKLTRNLPPDSPLAKQLASQGRDFASQVLAMPPGDFQRREWELARLSARQELEGKNRQHQLDGTPLEVFDPARWLVEQVLLSPRAEADLRERAR